MTQVKLFFQNVGSMVCRYYWFRLWHRVEVSCVIDVSRRGTDSMCSVEVGRVSVMWAVYIDRRSLGPYLSLCHAPDAPPRHLANPTHLLTFSLA
jgi:hypothetical protein